MDHGLGISMKYHVSSHVHSLVRSQSRQCPSDLFFFFYLISQFPPDIILYIVISSFRLQLHATSSSKTSQVYSTCVPGPAACILQFSANKAPRYISRQAVVHTATVPPWLLLVVICRFPKLLAMPLRPMYG